jgi:hypothetical protein
MRLTSLESYVTNRPFIGSPKTKEDTRQNLVSLQFHRFFFFNENMPCFYRQASWCYRGFNCLVYRQLSANFMVVTTMLFAHTTFLWATCCLICFIPIVKPFWHTDFDYGSYRLFNLVIGLTAGVTSQQGMLTPPWHLIPPLIYSEVCVRPISNLYFL